MQRFLLLYALAWAGAAIAYVPFLSILLPVRVAGLAGAADVSWLAYIAFAGAIAASAGHIAFGYLSDVTGNRRGWIWAGLILSCTLLFAVTRARDLNTLIVLIIGWQLALNMMLAPLAALAGDYVPDRQKGLLGGLMAFAPRPGRAVGRGGDHTRARPARRATGAGRRTCRLLRRARAAGPSAQPRAGSAR